jgi:hypothetical protein
VKTLRQYFGILIAATLLFFLIKPFVQTHTLLGDTTFQIQWRWLIPSFGQLLLYRSAYIVPFAKLLRGVALTQVSFRDVFTLFHLANITRYLPGRIWGVVRLLTLSERFGFSKTAVGVSLTLHVGIETALGGLIATSLIFSKQIRSTAYLVLERVSGHAVLFTLFGIGIVTSILFLIPKMSSKARQFLKTLQQIGTPLLQKHFLKQWFNIFQAHILLWCCQGLAFFLFVKSLASVQWEDVGVFSACYAFAWIVGFLSFLTPGGLGVREGLLGLLLTNYMPTSQATFIALLCRVWMLSSEIILAGTAFLLYKGSDRQS